MSLKADIYSLGILLHEIVTRTRPIRRGLLFDPRVPEECPRDIVQLIGDCIVLAAEDRPDTKEVFDRLRASCAAHTPPVPPGTPPLLGRKSVRKARLGPLRRFSSGASPVAAKQPKVAPQPEHWTQLERAAGSTDRAFQSRLQRAGSWPQDHLSGRESGPLGKADLRRRSAEVLAEAAVRVRFHRPPDGPQIEPPSTAVHDSSQHEASAASSGLVAISRLPRRSAACVAGALQCIQWSVCRPPAGAAPAAAGDTESLERPNGAAEPNEGASAPPDQAQVQRRPPWQPRSWRPGGEQPAAAAAVGEGPPAAAAAAVEAAAALASPREVFTPPRFAFADAASQSPPVDSKQAATQLDFGTEPSPGTEANPFAAAAQKGGWDE